MTIWQITLGLFVGLMGLSFLTAGLVPAVLMGVLGIVAGIAVIVGK